MPFELFYIYVSDRSYGLIGFGLAFTSSLWIGLDWVIELMDWIGLDLEKWTHVQLCAAYDHVIYFTLLSFKPIKMK